MKYRSFGAVNGIVQGVGFRPFIYQLARRCRLTGYVVNTARGVHLEVEGTRSDIDDFFTAISEESPPLAQIHSLERRDGITVRDDNRFSIQKSLLGDVKSTLISPDVCVCDDCLRELKDPRNRRYRYPFINCTNCGPRYTIIKDIPYDRPLTTMSHFEMCPSCMAEYENPDDRRFHAQPNACPDCGPQMEIRDKNGKPFVCKDPVSETIARLKKGRILAIKGLGGFHLAVDAENPEAVARLRVRKHREEKPFAIMVKDLEAARRIALLSKEESEALDSIRRPIVLVRKNKAHGLAALVAPRNRFFGVMLPYTPLHYLLFSEGGFRALVMTSGNLSEEPITIDNEDAILRLGEIADDFLIHNRDIYLRSDDSIVRVVDGALRQVRRSRGYVPVPVFLPGELSVLPAVLAVGAELKNTVCLTKGPRAFLSQHVGDMENMETYEFFKLTITHLEKILEIEPKLLAMDLHPDYLSTRYARERTDLPAQPVQHHHAHIVSVLAENGAWGPVIGIALDGTGLGDDNTIWGGEILVADLVSYKRAAHLQHTVMPGGDGAARNPWRMALSYLYRCYGSDLFQLDIPFVKNLDPAKSKLVTRMVEQRVHSPLTSSCGRLFESISALLGICLENRYEGQAAVELEMTQDEEARGDYGFEIQRGPEALLLMTDPIIRAVVGDLEKGLAPGTISRRFHNTMIKLLTSICIELRDETGIHEVAMSGGVFQNATLLRGLTHALQGKGFRVYTHSLVPTNDGGISLGQAVCAGLKGSR